MLLQWLREEIAVYRLNHPKFVWQFKPVSTLAPSCGVTEKGKLLFDRRDHTPIYPWTKCELETRLKRMLDNITKSGYDIKIDAIVIETHVATGLWNEGTIRLEHLKTMKNIGHCLALELDFLGERYTVKIPANTYYCDYEFWVSGHPDGRVRVRDIANLLAEVTAESIL